MARITPSLFVAFVVAAACLPSASFAQSETIRLSDEQRDAILAANSEERAAAARNELPVSQNFDRAVHGEVGVFVGTNGARGAYGVADIPISDSASATVAIESSRTGDYRRR